MCYCSGGRLAVPDAIAPIVNLYMSILSGTHLPPSLGRDLLFATTHTALNAHSRKADLANANDNLLAAD